MINKKINLLLSKMNKFQFQHQMKMLNWMMDQMEKLPQNKYFDAFQNGYMAGMMLAEREHEIVTRFYEEKYVNRFFVQWHMMKDMLAELPSSLENNLETDEFLEAALNH